jgi:hypothetical protein
MVGPVCCSDEEFLDFGKLQHTRRPGRTVASRPILTEAEAGAEPEFGTVLY